MMDSNQKNNNLDQEREYHETTKEVINLRDLTSEALDNMDIEYKNEIDESIATSDLIFETQVETKEKVIEELKKEVTKENVFQSLKKKWNNLEKKYKILAIISGVLLILLLLGLSLFFLLKEDAPIEEPSEVPDVIIEMENYRYENGLLIFLKDDTELGSYECENKDEELCKVASVTIDTTMDETKYQLEDGSSLKINSKIYKDRYVFLFDNKSLEEKSIQLYDLKEKKVLVTVFDVQTFMKHENHVAMKNEEGYYSFVEFTDESMNSVIGYDSKYDEIHVLPGNSLNKLVVTKDNNSYLANLENKILTKAFNKKIVGANDKYVKTVEAGVYQVFDYNAKEIYSDGADFVELLDTVMLVIKNKKLSVYDYEKHPLIGGSLSLKNEHYNPAAIYKDNKLVETKKSFDYEMFENRLSINVYENGEKANYSYNLNEGILSAKLAFMNYFDGTLYFYSNQEKTDLIGTYTCNNRNNIEKSTEELTNCTIASDSFYRETIGNMKETAVTDPIGSIPIFGNQYAFIKDGDTIVLYDITLENQKSIAKYESVDSSSYTGTKEVTFANTSSMAFIAKSKSSSKFGVAQITQNGVEPLIPFEYDSIKLLGDYYVIQDKNGYSLYSLEGTKKTEDKNSPIVDYHKNYLKTYKDNVYYVHAFDKSISNTAYNYIELYDNYYAAVVNKKVQLFDYENKEITNGGVELYLDTYYGADVNAFRITFDSKYAYIEVGNTTGSYGNKIKYSLTGEVEDEPIVEPEEDNNENTEEEDSSESANDEGEGSEENES